MCMVHATCTQVHLSQAIFARKIGQKFSLKITSNRSNVELFLLLLFLLPPYIYFALKTYGFDGIFIELFTFFSKFV